MIVKLCSFNCTQTSCTLVHLVDFFPLITLACDDSPSESLLNAALIPTET